MSLIALFKTQGAARAPTDRHAGTQAMSMACGSTGEPLLSRLPNRACKVNSFLRFFAISLNKQRFSSRCFDCEQRSPSARSRLAFSRRGPCVPSRSALGLSHALHQVRQQGCPSSPALSSHGRKQARDSGHSPFRGPARGRSPRARIYLIFAPPPQQAGCNAGASLS